MRTDPIRQRPEGKNVPPIERLVSFAVGALVTELGRRMVRRGRWLGWALVGAGSLLGARGASGHCTVTRALFGRGQGVTLSRSITVRAPREDVYAFLRDLGNLPRFMDHVKQVLVQPEGHSRWIVSEAGSTFTWTTDLTDDVPGKRLAWRSEDDSDIDNRGRFELSDAHGGTATHVHVKLSYGPPVGTAATGPQRRFFAALTDGELAAELTRMREILEAPPPDPLNDIQRLFRIGRTPVVGQS
jgi:uncharacterized membrane protein